MENNEKILFSNTFGSVTDKRIILNYKSGTEDLPVGQITSVSYQHKRNHFLAFSGFLIAISVIVAMIVNISDANALIILLLAIVSLLSGIANWIGHHDIQISVGGKDRKPLKAEMSKTREGREFVAAIKSVVIK